jgi:serine/threonine protein kinase
MAGVPLRAILLSELTPAPKSSRLLSQRRFACYSETPVLVDPKTYGEDPDDALGERVYNRVVDLATTLGSLRSDDYLTLQCIGYVEKNMQFCFLYSLPPGCEPPPTPTPPPSLFDLVNSSFKPSVTARIQLAYRLAYSISKIHNEGWLHKGIRSENVLLFPSRWGAPRSLDSPRLVGFDFARKDGPEEYSEKPVLVLPILISISIPWVRPTLVDKGLGRRKTETNIYRHPDALRDPNTTFSREHDYYGLGIVMVEIAVWRCINSILKKHTDLQREECKENDVRKVRDILLDEDSQENHPRDIAFRMGDIYWKVVKTCLKGEFGVPKGAEEQLLLAYQRDVVGELRRCVI